MAKRKSRNRGAQRRNVVTVAPRMNDSLGSVYTSLGEKTNAITYKRRTLKDSELMDMYSNSWVVQKYIDKTADDMLKLPRELTGDVDSGITQKISDLEAELKVQQVFRDALTWASLLGDSLIVAVTDCEEERIGDGLSLGEENIIKFLVFRKGEYTPGSDFNDDVSSKYFGEPESYQINVGKKSLNFHHTRCHRTKLGKQSIRDRKAPGTSDLQSRYDAIKIFDTAIISTGDTIQEANVDVLFLPNLNNQIASGQEAMVREYLEVMKRGKSSTGILAIDAGDTQSQGRYEQKNAQFAGLSDVITKMANVLAGALDRPITVLFGQSASGFNSGEEDNKAYYETINGLQESRLRPMQDFVDQFILDKLAISDELKYTYPTIDSINEAEEAARFTAYSTGFVSMLQASLINDETVLREMVARGLLITVAEDDISGIVESSGYGDYGTSTTSGAQTGATQTTSPTNASSPAEQTY